MPDRQYPYDAGDHPIMHGCRECSGDEDGYRTIAVPVSPPEESWPPRMAWLCRRCWDSLGGVYGLQVYVVNGSKPHTGPDSRCVEPDCSQPPTGHIFSFIHFPVDPGQHYCREHGERQAGEINRQPGERKAGAEFHHTGPTGPPAPLRQAPVE